MQELQEAISSTLEKFTQRELKKVLRTQVKLLEYEDFELAAQVSEECIVGKGYLRKALILEILSKVLVCRVRLNSIPNANF